MGFFSSLGSSLKKTIKKVGNFVEDTAGKVYSAAKPAVNQVYSDGKSVVSFVGNQIDKTGDTYRGAVSNLSGSTAGLISNVGEGVKDVGQGIGNFMPWIAGGAAVVAGAYLMQIPVLENVNILDLLVDQKILNAQSITTVCKYITVQIKPFHHTYIYNVCRNSRINPKRYAK
jgi:hypothetical protein